MTNSRQIQYPPRSADATHPPTTAAIESHVDLYVDLLNLCRDRGVQYRLICPPKEAAELLGVSTKTLERMRAEGTGPRFTLIGQRIRYPMSELWDWIQQQPLFDDSVKFNEELEARRAGAV